MDLMTLCSVCLACTVLVVLLDGLSAVARGRRLRASDVAWALLPVAAQAAVWFMAGQGLVAVDEGSETLAAAMALNAFALLAAHAALSRRRIAGGALDAARPSDDFAARVISVPICVLALMAAGFLCVLALEVPHNQGLSALEPQTVFLEWMLLSGALVALYFLAQRRGFLAAIVPLTSTGFGIAEYFLYVFKGQPLQPGDLLSAGTGVAVASSYTYTLSASCLWGIAFGLAALATCAVVAAMGSDGGEAPVPAARGTHSASQAPGAYRTAGTLANLVAGLAVAAALVTNVSGVDYAKEYGIEVSAWSPQVSYETQAYLPTFISAWQAMVPTAPEGYTAEGAQALLASYEASYDASELTGASEARRAAREQFDAEKPSVVCIMNETFADLSLFDGMRAGYEGPTYLKSLDDCILRGTAYVSVNGGGTTNSEFEFLTGNSVANLGSGVYPYNVYNMGITENLARQFKQLGYGTLAMHPNRPSNWNRENVYDEMGFDEFWSIADFAGADTLRGMVTDRATYDKVLDRLSSSEGPQFIFDVTMQNHSGYDTNAVPEEDRVTIEGDWGSDPAVNEYASCIARSDADLEYLLSELSQLDRKVVVLMFGDHQPYFTGTYNDAWFAGESEVVHRERLYQTPYLMWANYDVAGSAQESEVRDLATSSLASNLLQEIGAPLTVFQKAHIEMGWALPIENAMGYEDLYGEWHLPGEASGVEVTDAARADFATLQFWNMFRDGEGIFNAKMQDETNTV